MTGTWLSHDYHMTHLPEHALPRLPLQQGTMSGDGGEERLRGTLTDSCTVIDTQVRQTSGRWCGRNAVKFLRFISHTKIFIIIYSVEHAEHSILPEIATCMYKSV